MRLLLHLGVRRSPLRTVDDVKHFADRIAEFSHLEFRGLMGYEAHIAGLSDKSTVIQAMKSRARPEVEKIRRELSAALRPTIFNGGGSGSLSSCAKESALTEVTVGSAFLDSHLFDNYRDLLLKPAAYFALQVVRQPSPNIVTCHGGGFVASGGAGKDRLPVPWYPAGLSLLDMEGAGEVQTPLRVAHFVQLGIGDPVFFRHAKAGELADHVNEYLLIRGSSLFSRAKTYRGQGQQFLG